MALGTPLYMSPEQHLGQTVDSRSDQFSFCVALYEALYGQLLFAGDTVHSLCFNVVSGRIKARPADSHVPTIVHEAILRGLSTQPEARFPSMSELLAALSIDIARDSSIGPGARREVVVGMLGVILIAGLSIKVPEWSGLNPQRATLTTSAILFALFVAMVIRFRRVIGKNWFHRGMMMYGVIVAVWMLALRGVAVLIGLSLSQIMTLDLLAIAVITTLTAVTVQTKLWVLIPIASVGTVIAALRPDSAQILMPLVLQLGYALSAFLWYRAAITPRQRRPQEAK